MKAILVLAGLAAMANGYIVPSMKLGANDDAAGVRRINHHDRRSIINSGLVGTGALALGLAGAPRVTKAEGSAVPEEGIMAPDFTLPSSLGKDLSLADLIRSKKYTVLYFFPQVFTSSKSSCPVLIHPFIHLHVTNVIHLYPL